MPASSFVLISETDPDTVASEWCVDVGAMIADMLTVMLCNDKGCRRSEVYNLIT